MSGKLAANVLAKTIKIAPVRLQACIIGLFGQDVEII